MFKQRIGNEKGDKINPYSYAEKLAEIMIQKRKNTILKLKTTIDKEVDKPITLFFIDNIDEYRNKEGYIKNS